MPSKTFADYNQNNPITSAWLNGINSFVFGGLTSPAAWVRFNGTTGAIVQSYGVASVTVNSAGNYTIAYTAALPNAQNCHNVTTNQAGFNYVNSESSSSITIVTANTSNTPTSPTEVSLVVFGQYSPNF